MLSKCWRHDSYVVKMVMTTGTKMIVIAYPLAVHNHCPALDGPHFFTLSRAFLGHGARNVPEVV